MLEVFAVKRASFPVVGKTICCEGISYRSLCVVRYCGFPEKAKIALRLNTGKTTRGIPTWKLNYSAFTYASTVDSLRMEYN